MRAALVALLWMARASGLRSGPPIAWSIAGSDSGGGAGVEADLRTFRALGVHGCAVVTSLTAQNSLGVAAALETPPSHVAATIAALESDLAPACVKVGMLSGAGAACTVLSAVAAVGSFLALLICIGTNPRGAPHITACVTWAFLRIVWGCLLLRALVDATRGSAFTMVRVLAGGALQRPVAVAIVERFGVGKQ